MPVCLLVECVLVCMDTTLFDSRNPHHLCELHAVLPLRRNSVIFFAFEHFCNLKSIKFESSVTWNWLRPQKRKIIFLCWTSFRFQIEHFFITKSIVLINSIWTLFLFRDSMSYKHTFTECRLINWPFQLVHKNDQ